MAKFTIALDEYLQENMSQGQSINDLDDVLSASKEHLFDGAPNQAVEDTIKEEYRDPFILGFTSHFLFDEIGMETMPAWKLVLASKILEVSGFINSVFEKLDNQVWSDYKVRKRVKKDTHTGTVDNTGNNTLGGTITDEHDLAGSSTRLRHGTSANSGTIKDKGGVEYKGETHNNNERYYSAVDENGNPINPKIKQNYEEMDRPEDSVKAYNKSTRSGIYGVTGSQKGRITDTMTDHGSDVMTERDGAGDKAYVQRTPTGERINTQAHKGGMLHGYSDHAGDITQANNQTPQSGIDASNIMGTTVTPTAYSGGSGSVATPDVSGTKKYLTSVNKQWSNDRAHSEWQKPIDDVNGDVIENHETFNGFHDKQETHFNRVQEHSFNNRERQSERSFTGYEQETVTDYDSYGHNPEDKSEQHFNRKTVQETEYDKTFKEHSDGTTSFVDREDVRENTRTLGDTNTVDDNDQVNSTDEGTLTHVYDRDDGHTNLETRDLTDESADEETSFNFSYEMFVKAEPYLSKLWSMFDDCFMQIIDDEWY